MRYGSIYLIENKVNGKKYVGQTIFTVDVRWNNHIKGPKKSAVAKAIQKYGVDNFNFIELCSSTNEEYLNELEVSFIKEFKCYGSYGYNMTFGGDASKGKFTPEVRKKMSLAKLGKKRGPRKDNQSGSSRVKTQQHAQRLEDETTNVEYNSSTSPRLPSKYELLKPRILEMYLNFNSSPYIAKQLNLDKSQILRYLKKWGALRSISEAYSIRNKKRYRILDETKKQICVDFLSGLNLNDLNKKYKISQKRISLVLKEENIV